MSKVANEITGVPGVSEIFRLDGRHVTQVTTTFRRDTGDGGAFLHRGRVFFTASGDPFHKNPHEICQLFSIDQFGGEKSLRQVTHLPWDGRPAAGCDPPNARGTSCLIENLTLDPVTETVLFRSSCDPVGANPFGEQVFAMRLDGTGLRQLTRTRGMWTDPDGTIHVELPGPAVYPSAPFI